MLQAFREQARRWETAADGFLLSFIGKTPGLAVRLALVFAFLDWAASDEEIPPTEINAYHFGRASIFVTDYVLPMARTRMLQPPFRSRKRRLSGWPA